MEQINIDRRQLINSIISSLVQNDPLNGTVSAAAEKNSTDPIITTTPLPS